MVSNVPRSDSNLLHNSHRYGAAARSAPQGLVVTGKGLQPGHAVGDYGDVYGGAFEPATVTGYAPSPRVSSVVSTPRWR